MGVVEIAQELISFRSVNPPGDEEACARYVKDLLEDWGFEAEILIISPNRANVLVSVGAETPGLLLEGHLDVVSSGEVSLWSSDPFEGVVKEDRLYGRGSADMKGADAAMLQALGNLRREEFRRRLILALTADEESQFSGAFRLIDEGKVNPSIVKYGLVAEPTENQLVIAHKKSVYLQLKVLGKATHSSVPHLGVNAVEQAAKYLMKLNQVRIELFREEHPLLTSTTISTTQIAGGLRHNIIPDSCTVNINCRVTPPTTAKQVLERLQELSSKLSKEDPDFHADVQFAEKDDRKLMLPTLDLAQGEEWVKIMERISGSKPRGVPYGTEAPIYIQQGIPTVVLGPGSVDQAHTVDEFVEVRQLQDAVKIYEAVIREVCH